jgi:hypothetical protein
MMMTKDDDDSPPMKKSPIQNHSHSTSTTSRDSKLLQVLQWDSPALYVPLQAEEGIIDVLLHWGGERTLYDKGPATLSVAKD